MATVIDSLFIELGLDSSKFNAGQKKAVDSLRQLDEAHRKSAENIQRGAKNTRDSFDKSKDSLIAFGTVLLAAGGFAKFVTSMVNSNAALGRTSQQLQIGVADLKAWEGVLKSNGGTLTDFTTALGGMQEQLAAIRNGGGNTVILEIASKLGALDAISVQSGVNIYKLADALKAKYAVDKQQAQVLAEQLGISRELFQVMILGGDALKAQHEAHLKLVGATEANSKAAREFQVELGKLSAAMGGAFDDIMTYLYGLKKYPAQATATIQFFRNLSKEVYDVNSAFVALGKVWDKIIPKIFKKGAADWLTGKKQTPTSTGQSASGVFPPATNAGQKPVAREDRTPNTPAGRLMQYFQSKGLDKAHAAALVGNLIQESSLNPKATNQSQLGTHRGLAQWSPARQADFKAFAGFDITDAQATSEKQADFILYELNHKFKTAGKKFYSATNTKSASDVIFKQYENPGDNTGAKRAAYSAALMGAGATAPVNAGQQSSNETNIQTINVQTQATDADGMARGLRESLSNNQLMNFSTSGNK